MTGRPIPPAPDRPSLTPQAERDRQDRLDREAAALRANLLRRKDQHRQRQATPVTRHNEN